MFGNKITKTILIEGMSCRRCSKRVEEVLKSIKGIKNVTVSLEERKAKIILKDDISNVILTETVEDLGFKVANIENL